MSTTTKVLTVLAAAVFLVPGVWSFLWPRSFHETVALFDPFNLHLFHDLGAFQLGIGAAVLAALVWHDALTVALAGASAGAALHAVSHVLDRDLGGRASDPWLLSLLAAALIAALVLRLRTHELPRERSPGERSVGERAVGDRTVGEEAQRRGAERREADPRSDPRGDAR